MSDWRDDEKRKGSPRWWYGPLAALGMASLLLLIFQVTVSGGHPLALPLLFTVPAMVGYAVSVRRAATVVAEATAIGTSLGWVLFMGLITINPIYRLPGVLALLILSVLAVLLMWATPRLGAGLAARLATRFSWSGSR